jgi:hypothetical protein
MSDLPFVHNPFPEKMILLSYNKIRKKSSKFCEKYGKL